MAYFYGARRPKYNNQKVEIDGQKFDSKKEAARYQELKRQERTGFIKDLKTQVAFEICPKIPGVKGSRARKYVADFTYTAFNGAKIIEDVKSAITRKNPVYTLKKQLVQWQYPDWEFIET
jgi:hypothetical protein